MNVFADLHHGDLFYSLQLLFERRLGWKLYRPIGMEWFTNGYWKIGDPYPNPADTARQYLSIEDRDWHPKEFLNADVIDLDGMYSVFDPVHGVYQRAITFDHFRQMQFDIVISSIPAHEEPFSELIARYQPHALHIAQIGNIGQETHVSHVLASTAPHPSFSDKQVVYYHQEFDTDVYEYVPPTSSHRITSFVNLHPEKEIYEMLKSALPEMEFRAYGEGCPDGNISGAENIAQIMQESGFGLHLKPGGDGYGHVIHNWIACGRPVIVDMSHYRGKIAEPLLIHGETCIDVSQGFASAIEMIRSWSQDPIRHQQACEATAVRFGNHVSFYEESGQIKETILRWKGGE